MRVVGLFAVVDCEIWSAKGNMSKITNNSLRSVSRHTIRESDVGKISLAWIMLTSGTVLPVIQENIRITLGVSVLMFLTQLVFLFRRVGQGKIALGLALYLVICLIVTISAIANSDFSSALTYVRLMLAIGIACGCAALIDRSEGVRFFVNFVALVSLFSLLFFYGELVERYSLYFNVLTLNKTQYYNSFAYVQLIGIEPRNVGIYIEPGLFQIYLNLAIFAILYAPGSFKYKYLKLAVIVLALVSTGSTSGYIVGVLIVSAIAFKNKSGRFKHLQSIFQALFVTAIVFFVVSSSTFTDNIESKFSGNAQASWLSRKNSTLADLDMIGESPLVGVGAGNYLGKLDTFSAYGYKMDAAANTYTQLTALLGVPFILIIGLFQLKSLVRIKQRWIVGFVLAAVWVLSFVAQPFVLYPFFYLPVFLSFNFRRLRSE